MTEPTGQLMRDFGMAQMKANTPDDWREKYAAEAERWFASIAVGTAFMGEHIREAIEPIIGKAHHPNAWSAAASGVIRKWKTDRRARDHGAATSKAVNNRACLRRQYLKVR